jgi:hypothetical protein
MISKTKNKDIDFDDLILKVKNDAKELMKKKSKQQKYSKSRRQGLLIGGAYVKLDDEVKDGLRTALSKIAPLVLLLKHTVKVKMANKFNEIIKNEPSETYKHNKWVRVETLIHRNLSQTTDSEGIENTTYGYDVFESTFLYDDQPKLVIDYKDYGIKKEIETLNSFKILFKLLNIEPVDDPDKGTLYHGGALEERGPEEIDAANELEIQKNEKFKQDTNKVDFKFVAAPLDVNFINLTEEERKASILKIEKETTQKEKNKLIRIYNAKNSEFIKNLERIDALTQMHEKKKILARKKEEESKKELEDFEKKNKDIEIYKNKYEKKLKEFVTKKERPKYIQEFESRMNFAQSFFDPNDVEDRDKYIEWVKQDFKYQKSLNNSIAIDTKEIEEETMDELIDIKTGSTDAKKSSVVFENFEQQTIRLGNESKLRRKISAKSAEKAKIAVKLSQDTKQHTKRLQSVREKHQASSARPPRPPSASFTRPPTASLPSVTRRTNNTTVDQSAASQHMKTYKR